jgi:hypothetical protein
MVIATALFYHHYCSSIALISTTASQRIYYLAATVHGNACYHGFSITYFLSFSTIDGGQ